MTTTPQTTDGSVQLCSLLRALVCELITGSFKRAMLQFTASIWQKASSRRLTFQPSSMFSWSKYHWKCLGITDKRRFTITDVSSGPWLPFRKPFSPQDATFPPDSWKHSHQECLNTILRRLAFSNYWILSFTFLCVWFVMLNCFPHKLGHMHL